MDSKEKQCNLLCTVLRIQSMKRKYINAFCQITHRLELNTDLRFFSKIVLTT